ncbi:amino acid-binding protein [uncultured Megasphaera sp.]|uniref:amino acid-binding protein n=1 Tax=Megasphaera massiliensis TaxID=1232428 RepID=UPI00266C0014|nr:amino acid-binding protein [uncultured Megasphaera sp.]
MLHQVSVFAENNKGTLRKMTSILADANINIYTMLANDSAEFGIIRLIVTDPELAVRELKKAGYQCHMDRVVAVEMGDTPGCLDKILDHLCQANVAIDYLYISYNRQTATPVAIFKTREMETETFLRGKGYRLLDTF